MASYDTTVGGTKKKRPGDVTTNFFSPGDDGGYNPPDPPPYVPPDSPANPAPAPPRNPYDPPPDEGGGGDDPVQVPTYPTPGHPGAPPNERVPPDAPAPPAPPAPPTGRSYALPGWDQAKWEDASRAGRDTKYDVGKILSKYAPTLEGLRQAWAEIQKMYPGATFDNKDTISGLPGTMGPVDVLVGASQGGTAWWWGDTGGLNAERQAKASGQPVQYPTSSPYPTSAAGAAGGTAATPARAQLGPNPYTGILAQINDFFRAFLGRDASQQEVSQWGMNVDANYLRSIGQAIANTEEAKQYAASRTATPVVPGTTVPTAGTTTPTTDGASGGTTVPGGAPAPTTTGAATGTTGTTGATTNTLGPNPYTGIYAQINDFFRAYMGRDGSQQEVSQWGQNIDANYLRSIGQAIFNTQEAQRYRQQATAPAPTPAPTAPATPATPATPANPAHPGSSYNPQQVFDDPATRDYINLLNERIRALLAPQENPEMDSLLAYMRQYFQQLQNPVYTDAQRDLINTQALDPMERQRQARKQQVLQRMAARGMGPSDGPTLQALQDVDREFDELRTRSQSGLAVNEINLGRENQSQAVNVGSAAAGLRGGLLNLQDQRANTALGMARQIPDMARERLQTAIGLLNQGGQLNPAQLLQVLNSFGQTGNQQNQQDSQYWQQIIAALARAFGL